MRTARSTSSFKCGQPGSWPRAFTLIELMVVIGIVALVMTISVPAIYRQLHPESLQRTVREILEVCHAARAQAILSGRPTDLVINTVSRTISVSAASPSTSSGLDRLDSPDVSGQEWRMPDRPSPSAATDGAVLTSTRIPANIQIEGIRLNFLDYTEDEIVRVRFYPNGTCDEFSLFLVSDRGERRQIFLEVVTALPDVETDPMKFR
jgi:prepilin-type N-terminal cleavage/methylation domain-containing protein